MLPNHNYAPGGGATPQGIPTGIPGFEEMRANFNARVQNALGLRQLEWLFSIPAQIVFPVSAGADTAVSIKRDAHFECFFITGDFTTLNADGVDDGVNRVSVKISDGSNDLKLFNNFVPVNLFLSPGRTLAAGIAGNPTSQLFYPYPFYHIFPANGQITVEGQNAGGANILNLLFWGRKLRAEIGNADANA